MKTFLIFLWKRRRLIARYLGIQMGLSTTAGVLDPIERSDRDGSSINVRKSVSVIFRTLIREWKVTLETFQRWCKCILTPGVSLRQHHHFHFSVSTRNFFLKSHFKLKYFKSVNFTIRSGIGDWSRKKPL